MGKSESKCDRCGKPCIDFWEVTSSREYGFLEPFRDYDTRFPQICWECSCYASKKIAEENKGLRKD